jgi:hypothetical protein
MRRSTWALLAILVVVALFWYLLNTGRISLPERLSETATPTIEASQFLFPEDQSNIGGIKVEDAQGQSVEIRRGAGGSWSLVEPEVAAADPALAESAATQAASLRILAQVEANTDLQVVGLDAPVYTITLETGSGDQVFLVGKPTVTGSGYYIRAPDGRILVVVAFGVDALTGLLAAPPYAETPTPSPQPTAAPGRGSSPVATP